MLSTTANTVSCLIDNQINIFNTSSIIILLLFGRKEEEGVLSKEIRLFLTIQANNIVMKT